MKKEKKTAKYHIWVQLYWRIFGLGIVYEANPLYWERKIKWRITINFLFINFSYSRIS